MTGFQKRHSSAGILSSGAISRSTIQLWAGQSLGYELNVGFVLMDLCGENNT